MRIKKYFSLSIVFAFLVACGSHEPLMDAKDIPGTFKRGLELFKKKNWERAEEVFNFVLYNDPAGKYADDAQFYLAETYFKRGEYETAMDEYDRLLNRMPDSPFAEKAYWRKAQAAYKTSPDYRLDQEPTLRAIEVIQNFLATYPNSEHRSEAEKWLAALWDKLAHKLYGAGRLYENMGEYEAALIYYRSTWKQYPNSKYAIKSRLHAARCLLELGQTKEAKNLLRRISKGSLDKKDKYLKARLLARLKSGSS